MAYRSAILGCGPRAACHIEAYDGIDSMRLVAACDMKVERLRDCGDRFRIPALYDNFEEMLAKEKPDILHIVTPPSIREEPIASAAEHGVKAIVVEKPIALTVPQARAIRDIASRTGLKIAVNTQRRYYAAFQQMKAVIHGGEFGEIRFMRMVTRGNILSWGPHVMDLILFFLNDVAPTSVWAAAYGMNGHDYGHPAPAGMLMALAFPHDVTVYMEAADDAIGVPGAATFWEHAEFDVWGTRGRAWWTASQGCGHQCDGDAVLHVEETGFELDEAPGQQAFTRAVGRWLECGDVHGCRLENALLGFDITMTAYLSAHQQERLDFPAAVPDDITKLIETKLSRAGSEPDCARL